MTNDNEIVTELKRLTRLISLSATKDMSLTHSILFLAKVGFTPKDIADMLGTSSNFVSVTLSKSRKKEVKKS